jgi:uncharacterized membrane protein YvlD (DUF360 family)
MRRLILPIVAATGSLWLAGKFVPGVQVPANLKLLLTMGALLGLASFFLKPLAGAIAFPLKLLTGSLFNLIINLLLVWTVDIAFPELIIPGIIPLLWTTLIFSLLEFVLQKWLPE